MKKSEANEVIFKNLAELMKQYKLISNEEYFRLLEEIKARKMKQKQEE